MRDYLYIWNDPDQKFILASGIEFSDLSGAAAGDGGFLLLDHQSDVATYDPNSGFFFVPYSQSSSLAAEDIYSWGNFVWADFTQETPPNLLKQEVAELLYFSHKGEPLAGASIAGLGNRFLAYAHDDGWYLKLYYSIWSEAANLLKSLVPSEVLAGLAAGEGAFWVRSGEAKAEKKTLDVDKILNANL